ncbi:biliverdin-producing heme oxygenase [Devosia albogilva]|uniref:Biliverdin-producing heme oxygenase n=1 Tax=Devosia albogilva TaxID=429726 RepID=A0ABW5QLD3_9HYPH
MRDDLRQATRDIHQQLDDLVGGFGTLAEYRRYLVASHTFRRAAESALPARESSWAALSIVNAAERDLADLGCAPRAGAPALPQAKLSEAWRLGAHYVLEGSGIGARLLLRRAEALGLSGAFGARHLAQQAADRERWPRFLALLDTSDADRVDARAGAHALFSLALAAHREVQHERS